MESYPYSLRQDAKILRERFGTRRSGSPCSEGEWPAGRRFLHPGARVEHMSNSNPQKDKIGLREIAAAAGVSISTASRVLNGSSSVDPALKKTVLDAVTKLDIDLLQRDKAKAL